MRGTSTSGLFIFGHVARVVESAHQGLYRHCLKTVRALLRHRPTVGVIKLHP